MHVDDCPSPNQDIEANNYVMRKIVTDNNVGGDRYSACERQGEAESTLNGDSRAISARKANGRIKDANLGILSMKLLKKSRRDAGAMTDP